MKTLTVGGVPENINVPWYLALERGAFDDLGVDVRWKDCLGGTGQMCAGLASGELDVALVLTEGLVAHIHKGGTARIAGTYATTPLIWGIHTRADAPFEDPEDLRGRRFGVSRLGSGSHLMAFVDAAQRGWPRDEQPRIVKVGGIDGALEAFSEGRIDGFLWEKYMTKPLVDSGVLKRVGICTAPWPAFVIAAGPQIHRDQPSVLRTIIERVSRICAELSADEALVVDEVGRRYDLLPADTAEWFAQTRWYCRTDVGEAELREAGRHLEGVGVVDKAPEPASLIAPALCTIRPAPSPEMYSWRVQSIYNALADAGKSDGPLEIEELSALGHLDQYHYLGAAACEEAARVLGLSKGRRVLDVGSGVGGPARHYAHHWGCQITGVEIQSPLIITARSLTSRVGLDDRVSFINGDIRTVSLPPGGFDHFISQLVFLHLGDRRGAFDNCYEALCPGGTFLIEDLIALSPLSEDEQAEIEAALGARGLPTSERYQAELEAAGFVDVHGEDLTHTWRAWASTRFERFLSQRDKHEEVHGESITAQRERFYSSVRQLFETGLIGGVRFTGRRRGHFEAHLLEQRQRGVLEGFDAEGATVLEFDY